MGTIPNGGTVKAPLGGHYVREGKVAWLLNNPDFATAANVAAAINGGFGLGTAVARDAQRIEVAVPGEWRGDPVSFIARMGEIEARHDAVARVVVNERTGTIIVGKDVHLREAAVAHGTLKVVVNTAYDVSQPSSFSKRGNTVVTPKVEHRRPGRTRPTCCGCPTPAPWPTSWACSTTSGPAPGTSSPSSRPSSAPAPCRPSSC